MVILTAEAHHEEVLNGVHKQFKDFFDYSEQAVYIYLDDQHVIWNKKFGELVGYPTPAAAFKSKKHFLELFVDGASQKKLVKAFSNAMESGEGSSNTIVWKHKSGKKKKTNTILVPIPYDGHLLALHFIK